MSDRNLEQTAAAQFDTSAPATSVPKCPITHTGASFKPFDRGFSSDPYAFLGRAIREEPIFYSPDIDHWVVTRYDDVKAVFQTPAVFSAANTLSAVTPMSPRVLQRLRDGGFRMNPVLTNLDPPAHLRIRKHVSNAFSPKRIQDGEPWIRNLVDAQIDRLLAKPTGPDRNRHAELVSELTYDLPAHVAFHFMGVPEEDVADVKAWTKNRVALTWGRCDEEAQLREVEGLLAMWRFCERRIDAVSEDEPTFLGDLVRFHRAKPDELSINEIESILFTMLVAGHETTTNAASNGLVTLLSERERWQRLVDDPDLVVSAVDEMLRYRPSVISWRRVAACDTTLGAHHIPKGGRLLLMLASANHDDGHFANPEMFDPCRKNAKDNLSFGYGAHFCIGAPLARLEMKVIFEQLTRRLPTLSLDQPQLLDYTPNLSFWGPSAIRVHW
jgi:cytochrome P450